MSDRQRSIDGSCTDWSRWRAVVTFLQNERQGSVQSGNAVSGFWGGIALGRLILPYFNITVGERRVIFPYTAAAIALEVWILVHRDLISNGEHGRSAAGRTDAH